MKAIILKEFGGVDQLQLAEVPTPGIKDGEVLIEVKAISINPVDVKTRQGKGRAGLFKEVDPKILGWDVSGIVKESRSLQFEEGDAVFGMVNFPGVGAGYAEYVAAPADQLALKPADVGHPEAAAACLAALTAWQAFADFGKLRSGQRILIHAAAGGVGHFAVQIAKYIGAYVIGTASAENREFVLGLGADEHIDYKSQDVSAAVHGVDFVLDTIGGDNIDLSLKTMKKGATIVSIPSGANEKVKEKAEAAGMKGMTMSVQSSGEDMEHIAQMLEGGVVKAVVSKSFPLEKMGEAHLQVESHKTRGKAVVTL
ncbi:MAG TPA: NADP-dependent oxidoreductase [Puia sp.]|jgi:NADPH:quinone reductase-like Zn-dependent oxidoreductase